MAQKYPTYLQFGYMSKLSYGFLRLSLAKAQLKLNLTWAVAKVASSSSALSATMDIYNLDLAQEPEIWHAGSIQQNRRNQGGLDNVFGLVVWI